LAKIIEPKVAGGRNTTWPSARCGAISRTQDQFGATDGFGDVGRHQRQLHVVAAVDVLDENAGARCAMGSRLGGITPP
jgi:hypothetical protein